LGRLKAYAAVTHICKPLQAQAQTKVCKRVCLPNPKGNSFFFFPPFGVLIFFANAQPMTDKLLDYSEQTKKFLQLDTDDRTPSANNKTYRRKAPSPKYRY
jgi:hypothetical protein